MLNNAKKKSRVLTSRKYLLESRLMAKKGLLIHCSFQASPQGKTKSSAGTQEP